MATAELELLTERVSSVSDPRSHELERVSYPSPRFEWHVSPALEEQSIGALYKPDLGMPSLPGPLLTYRLAVSGAEPAAIDVLLQVVELETTPSLKLVLRTPEDARAVTVEMRVNMDTNRLNMHYSIELPGLPIQEALLYTRFLKGLYSEGTLSIILLEAGMVTVGDVALPIPLEETKKQDLEWNLQLFENLRDVEESTGVEMVAPGEIEDQELDNLERIKAILQAGWVRDYVSEFTLPVGLEAAKNLLDYGATEIDGLAITTEHEPIQLFGTEIDLGHNIRWVSKARLETPLSRIREWLASDPSPENGIETRWTPVGEVPVHAVFHEWPKPSLERIQEDIKAFEREYGMSWKTFSRLWQQGKSRARRIDDGQIWISLIEARDALKQES